MTNKELEKFIEDNHLYMTLAEIKEATQKTDQAIRYIIDKRGFNIVTKGERAIGYIKRHPHMTFNDLMDKLELSEASLNGYLLKLGFKRLRPKHHNTPLNMLFNMEVVEAPPPIHSKADAFKSVFNKYKNTLTWDQLVGGKFISWSSI